MLVGVLLIYPKFSPAIVMVGPVLVGKFDAAPAGTSEIIGESKEKMFCLVPTVAPTVKTRGIFVPEDPTAGSIWHVTVVEVTHEAVAQLFFSTLAVTLKSKLPKDIPFRVMEPPPVFGLLLGFTSVGTGALNENPLTRVPTTAEIVTATWRLPSLAMALLMDVWHLIVVSDTQIELAQSNPLPIRAVGLTSAELKLKPSMVTVYPDSAGPLYALKKVITGESKENIFAIVPTTPPTVTKSARFEPTPACE